MSEVIQVEFPADKIWRPSHEERIATGKKLEVEFIMQRFGLDREKAEIVRRGSVGKLRDLGLTDAFKDMASNETEVEFKKFFGQCLMDQGYTAVEWKEPVKGVHQILVLDPKSIKVMVSETAESDIDFNVHPSVQDGQNWYAVNIRVHGLLRTRDLVDKGDTYEIL